MLQIKNITKLVKTESSFEIESEVDNYKWENKLINLDQVLKDCKKFFEVFEYVDDGCNYLEQLIDNDCFNLVIRRESKENLYIYFNMRYMGCRLLFETVEDFKKFLD